MRILPVYLRSIPAVCRYARQAAVVLFFFLLLIGILHVLAPASAAADDITLEWQRSNPVEDVVGYRIYYRIGGTGNGVLASYNGTGIAFDGASVDGSPIDSGIAIEVADLIQQDDLVSVNLRNLDSMQAYCFVVTAYNDDGQSGPSNEACKVVDFGIGGGSSGSDGTTSGEESEGGCFIDTAFCNPSLDRHLQGFPEFQNRNLLSLARFSSLSLALHPAAVILSCAIMLWLLVLGLRG